MTAEFPRFDVLGFGAVAVDDILFVDQFPIPDVKTRVLHRERHCGGLAATALVAAARLGASCAYAGTLGTDELSTFAESRLRAEEIDLSLVLRRARVRPIYSVVIVDRISRTRNIFYDQTDFPGPDAGPTIESRVRAARVLLVDDVGIEAMTQIASAGRDAGIPVVADFEGGVDSRAFQDLLELPDHLILSNDFASHLAGTTDPAACVRFLWTPARSSVIITCGKAGAWWLGDGTEEPRLQPAFPIDTVDTTGCGDVFHGAYAAMLASGLPLYERVRIASAAAALTAAHPGGQDSAPRWSAVQTLLETK